MGLSSSRSDESGKLLRFFFIGRRVDPYSCLNGPGTNGFNALRQSAIFFFRVRIYDEFVLGRWTRAMSLLDENAKPALEAQYMRIEDSR